MELNVKIPKWAAAAVAVVVLLSAGAVAGAQAGDNQGPPAGATRAGSSSPTEMTFVPITPCRIEHSLKTGGKFAAGETRHFRMAANLGEQGGNPAGCGIPSYARALEMNIATPDSEATGYLRVWPYGQAEPSATFLGFEQGAGGGNTGSVRMQPGLGSNMSVKVYGGRTHVIVDVFGYYVSDLFAVVSSAGNLVRGNGVVSVDDLGAGIVEVIFDRNVRGCAYTGTINRTDANLSEDAGTVTAAGLSGDEDGLYVKTFNAAGGLVDRNFHITVDC
jgi:hypothetical protein